MKRLQALYMKPVFILFIASILYLQSSGQQVRNPGFENNTLPLCIPQFQDKVVIEANIPFVYVTNNMLSQDYPGPCGTFSLCGVSHFDTLSPCGGNYPNKLKPVNGDTYIGLGQGTGVCFANVRTDTLFMELSGPLVSGNMYTLRFQTNNYFLHLKRQPGVPKLAIGLSHDHNRIQTSITTIDMTDSLVWKSQFISFIASDTFRYISFNTITYYGPSPNSGDLYGIDVDNILLDTCQMPLDPPPVLLDTLVCEDIKVLLKLPSSISAYPHLWNTGDTTDSIIAPNASLYSCITTFNNSCTRIDSFNIKHLIKVPLNMKHDTSFCPYSTVQVSGYHTKYNAYRWNTGDTLPQIMIYDSGTYVLSATNMVCSVSDSIHAHLYPQPFPKLPADDTLCFADIGTLELDAGPWKNYLWFPGGETTRTIEADQPGTYVITVTDYNNCRNRDTIILYNSCGDIGIYLPNAFTPNNDGINDVLFVKGMRIQYFELTLYNRWGEQVFISDDLTKGWDGNYKGKVCEEGAYTYQLVYRLGGSQVSETRKGTVTLIR